RRRLSVPRPPAETSGFAGWHWRLGWGSCRGAETGRVGRRIQRSGERCGGCVMIRRRARVVAAVGAAMMGAGVMAQTPEKNAKPAGPPWPLTAFHDPYRTGGPEAPLAALLGLHEQRARALEEKAWTSMCFELEATAATFAGDYALALEAEALHFEHA